MKTEVPIKIGDWMKINRSVTEAAKDLDVTRPTLYKYIEKYDAGTRESIPMGVLTYFDKIVEEEDGSTISYYLDQLEEEWRDLWTGVDYLNDTINSIKEKIKRLEKMMKDDDSNDHIKRIQNEIENCNSSIEKNHELLQKTETRIAEIEEIFNYYRRETTSFRNRGVFALKSKCFIKDGRCMIVHNGHAVGTFKLKLYIKFGTQKLLIKEFDQIADSNYFVIEEEKDNLIFTDQMCYRITGCDLPLDIYQENRTYGDDYLRQYANNPDWNTDYCDLINNNMNEGVSL